MEDKKPKNILVLMTPFDSNVPSFYELIKDLISLGHNVTCYVVDKLESKIKPTGAKLKIYSIDLNGMNKIPPAIRYRTYTPYSISLFYDAVLNDVTKSEEKYDYLIVDSFIDGNEINKIIKAKTVVSLYLNCLGQKTPFVELNLLHRKHY
jgi:hypothetical protein